MTELAQPSDIGASFASPTQPSPTGPWSGMHVVEYVGFVAGPAGGMTLAQLGVHVIGSTHSEGR